MIRRCTGIADLGKLFAALKKANGKDTVVQVFDRRAVISRMHLIGAYLDAIHAFEEKRSLANDIAMEMLLFASMDRQIGKAIAVIGAKPGKEFVVFANSKEAFSRLSKTVGNGDGFEPSQQEQRKTARKYGITQKEDLDKFVLQRMAIARIED